MDRSSMRIGKHGEESSEQQNPPTTGGDQQEVGASNRASASASRRAGDEQAGIDEVIGHFGKYQFLIFMFKILIGVTSAFNNLSVTFFAPSDFISFWCADSTGLSNANATIAPAVHQQHYYSTPLQSTLLSPLLAQQNNYHQNHTIVGVASGVTQVGYLNTLSEFISSDERNYKHELHLNYDTPNKTSLRKECNYRSANDNKTHKCSSYQYDTGIWISTIIDEWNLVCDRAWFISMTQALYMSGFIISFLVFGYISDRFGRWRSLLLGGIIEIVSGLGCAFATSVTWFMIFRFLIGLGNAGRSSSSYLIMIEWVGPKWRMYISTMGSLGWIIGYCSMPWITMYFLHFRHMQLFSCFYELVFLVWLLRLPETPRWLLTHKKFNEAYEVLLMAAKFNGLIKKNPLNPNPNPNHSKPSSILISNNNTTKIIKNGHYQDSSPSSSSLSAPHEVKLNNGGPATTTPTTTAAADSNPTDGLELSNSESTTLKPYTMEQFDAKFKRLVKVIEAKKFTKNENNLSIVDLFKWRNLRCYALILFFVWAINSFIYYGIALRVGDFGGKNLFIAFTIAGLTELPSMAFTILCMKFLPRRTTNLFIFTTCGLLCAIQVPLKYYNYGWLQQSTMMLAKLFNSCSFTVILYQTMELFPTSIRQTAYSACSLAGRIGSILAPFIKELSEMTNNSVPPVIYAVLCFMAAMFIKELPETKGTDLPDTLMEAENKKATGNSLAPTITHDNADRLLTRRKSISSGGNPLAHVLSKKNNQ